MDTLDSVNQRVLLLAELRLPLLFLIGLSVMLFLYQYFTRQGIKASLGDDILIILAHLEDTKSGKLTGNVAGDPPVLLRDVCIDGAQSDNHLPGLCVLNYRSFIEV